MTLNCDQFYKTTGSSCIAETCSQPADLGAGVLVEETELARLGFDVNVKCPTGNTWDGDTDVIGEACTTTTGDSAVATDEDDCIYNTVDATVCVRDRGEYVYECPE